MNYPSYQLRTGKSEQMRSFTLDTNCVLAVDEGRPEGQFVLQLAELHTAGVASVALVAVSASEKQKPLRSITNFGQFVDRIAKLGLGHLDVLYPMAYADISFWDRSLSCDEAMIAFEREIHQVLFPSIEFNRADYCAARGVDASELLPDNKWRNAKCDVQAFWSHAWRRRDVFVTSDRNFHRATKKPRLIALGGGLIETPKTALCMCNAGAI